MEIDKLTMTEKLLIVREINNRGELLVVTNSGDYSAQIIDEISVNFNKDKNRIIIGV